MLLKSIFLFTIGVLQFSGCWRFDEGSYKNLIQIELNIMKKFENGMSPEELALYRFDLIFPGTKWCGAGNIADGYDDLGTAVGTDKCCRTHDHCEDVLEAGESRYNLTNTSRHARLHCDCDDRFRVCLRKDNTDTSSTVGILYFNVIGTQCFRKDYNATGCLKYGGLLHTKCLKYEYDIKSKKFYQWFDVRSYY